MPEFAGWCPVAVVPLWRRGEGERGSEGVEYGNADRPGVPRGHSGPVGADQAGMPGKAVAGDAD
ncbi:MULTISPECIES: hypothetical protein [unclassified Kitasatospora]|uniref:hypothetical protein n=1 Tax=unclassified Kitasatospora TaxID=2633591 RepID=UPI003402BAA4